MKRFRSLGDQILMIGNNSLPKVCIYSFLIRVRVGENQWKFLNPAFVVSLLNDLFGIQSRSGCLCASMFGQKMLGVDLKLSREYKEALFDGNELLRLGYTRINLNFFIADEEIDYILSAIEFVAKYGWMLLPHY
jgi:selenocysteine lyase/cysteine desulfurase